MIPITESLRRDPDNDPPLFSVYGVGSPWVDWGKDGGFTAKMPANCQSLRLVVQHIWESSSGRSLYRLVGYSDEHTYRPVDFDTLDDLLKVLKAALPVFDLSSFPRPRQQVRRFSLQT